MNERKTTFAVISGCFLLSGVSSLIYQVVWAKMLTLVFGNTTFAYATILTVFMVGLALGSKWFGKYIDTAGIHPLKMYGLLEAGIGVYALLFPSLLKLQGHFSFLYQPERHFYLSSLILFLFCFVLLIIPTTLMGGTFPVLSKFFVRNFQKRNKTISLIYSLNTLGAVIGAFISGYLLMQWVGVSGSIYSASILNCLIALGCLFLGKTDPDISAPMSGQKISAGKKRLSGMEILILFSFFLSGFAAMFYEIAWTRILALILGSSVYAYSAMLTTFLLGISLGSYLFSKFIKDKISLSLFGLLEILIGVSCLLIIPVYNELVYWVYVIHSLFSQSNQVIQLTKFFICMLVMIIPTILFGATFPLVASLYTKTRESLGREIGNIYFWNTLGSTFGSFMVGFIFIPFIGIRNSILVAAGINLLVGNLLNFQNKKRVKIVSITFSLAIFLFSFSFDFNRKLLTSGLYSPQNDEKIMHRNDIAKLLRGADLLYYKEGLSSIVSLYKHGQELYLKVNGKTDASTNPQDMKTQKLLGHMPFLLNPRDRYGRVLVVGLGSGITAAAVSLHPVGEIYVVEIEKAIIEAAAFFKKENNDILNKKNVHIVITDGRHFIQNAKETFDVIISEPSNFWMAGVGNLFTQEFYRQSYKKLSQEGIFCQWMQGYNVTPELMQVVLKTFTSVFPVSCLGYSCRGDFLIFGLKSGNLRQNLQLDIDQLKTYAGRQPAVLEDLKTIGIESIYALKHFLLFSQKRIAEWTESSPINTDEFPLLEYESPKWLFSRNTDSNYHGMLNLRDHRVSLENNGLDSQQQAAVYLNVAKLYQSEMNWTEAISHARKAVMAKTDFIEAYHILAFVYKSQGMVLDMEKTLLDLLKVKEISAAHFELGEFYSRQNQTEKARPHYSEANRLSPADPQIAYNLAKVLHASGQYQKEIEVLIPFLRNLPVDIHILIQLSLAYRQLDQFQQAIRLLAPALSPPPPPAIYQHLADSFLGLNDVPRALHYYRQAYEADKENIGYLKSMAACLIRLKNFSWAKSCLREALRLAPFDREALELSESLRARDMNQ